MARHKVGSFVLPDLLWPSFLLQHCAARGAIFTGSPGVYLQKDSTKHKVEHYMRFVQLVPSLLFFAIKWEVWTHRNYRVTVSRQTDQWAQQPNSVILVALWVCSCHHGDMEGGMSLSLAWHPLLEANPVWPQAAARAELEDAVFRPVDTFSAQSPRNQAVTSASATVMQGSSVCTVGSFEWHFGDHGEALVQVRQLYKEACHGMSNLKFSDDFTDL